MRPETKTSKRDKRKCGRVEGETASTNLEVLGLRPRRA